MDAPTKALGPAALVNVQTNDRRALGTGYFNPKSLIAVRILDSVPDAEIGDAFFASHFARALGRRATLYPEHFYRLVHAEGDGLPGLTVDRFDETCVVQVTTAGMEALIEPMMEALVEVTACLPVYRTYIHTFDLSEQDRKYLEHTLALARRRKR